MVSFIVAVDRNFVIGNDQGIPWHLPADLKRFRRLTLGKPIVMGRTTFEHIGRPLDRRSNIVLSRQADYHPKGVLRAHSADEAMTLAGDVPEVMVIGGAQVYAAFMDRVSRLYLTRVEGDFIGTAYFPASLVTPAGFAWRETSREEFPADEKNPYRHRFSVIDRIANDEAIEQTLDVRKVLDF